MVSMHTLLSRWAALYLNVSSLFKFDSGVLKANNIQNKQKSTKMLITSIIY